MNIDPVIQCLLQPIQHYLDQENLMEMCVLQGNTLAFELADEAEFRYVKDDKLNNHYWLSLCHVLANKAGLSFNKESQPILSTTLPGGHRFEAMLGKNVDHGVSVSIRLKRSIIIPLENYGLIGEAKAYVLQQLIQGANILISGGMSSGKTTFLNQLVKHIPLDKRILTVEDVRDIDVPHVNCKHYILGRNGANLSVGYPEIINHITRSRPDIILVGEISVENSFPIVRLINLGHSGFMTTVHANTPTEALETAIPQNIQLNGMDASNITTFLYRTFDMVIQLNKGQDGKRKVTEILLPKINERLSLSI